MTIPFSEVRAAAGDILRAIRNRKHQRTETGALYVPVMGGVAFHGSFAHAVNGLDERIDPNIVTNEGMNFLLNAMVGAVAGISSWYIAPFTDNETPVVTTTAATFPAGLTEFTAYTSATRVAWAKDTVASQAVANEAVRASFTINGGGGTVSGAALTSLSTKSGTTGTLFAYSLFSAQRVLVAADVLTVRYTISCSSS